MLGLKVETRPSILLTHLHVARFKVNTCDILMMIKVYEVQTITKPNIEPTEEILSSIQTRISKPNEILI